MSTGEILGPKETPNAVLPMRTFAGDLNVYQLIDFRRGQVRRREFRPIGRLEKIWFEKSTPAKSDGNPLTELREAVTLDWYKTGPLLALSNDGQDLLVCGRLPHPPAIPRPDYVPPYPYTPKEFVNGVPVPPQWPKMEQRLSDRASGILPAENGPNGRDAKSDFWFVFQPVVQILVLRMEGGFGMIQCRADEIGRHTVFLYDARGEEGHILFGRAEMEFFRAVGEQENWLA